MAIIPAALGQFGTTTDSILQRINDAETTIDTRIQSMESAIEERQSDISRQTGFLSLPVTQLQSNLLQVTTNMDSRYVELAKAEAVIGGEYQALANAEGAKDFAAQLQAADTVLDIGDKPVAPDPISITPDLPTSIPETAPTFGGVSVPEFTDTLPDQSVMGDAPNVVDPVFVAPSAPVRPDVSVDLSGLVVPVYTAPSVDLPAAFIPAEITPIDLPEVPEEVEVIFPTAPDISNLGEVPTAPEANTFTVPEEPDLDFDYVFPESPEVTIPDFPTLQDVTIPEYEGKELPDAPVLTAPSVLLSEPAIADVEEVFDSTGLTALIDTANGYITDVAATFGQYIGFIREAVQSASDVEMLKQAGDIASEFSMAGFTRPSGPMDARLDAMRRDQTASRDRAIAEQAGKVLDTTNDWRKASLSAATALYGLMQDAWKAQQEVAHRKAQAVYEGAIRMQGFKIEAAKLDMQYQANLVSLYNAEVSAVNAAVEEYKALVQGLVATGQLNEVKAKVYASRIGAELARVSIFRAEVDAVASRIDADKSQIEAYQSRIEAFKVLVEADISRFTVYESQIRGFLAGAEVAKAKVALYEATIRGETAKIQAYQAQVQGYAATVDALVSAKRGEIDVGKAKIDNYSAQVNAFVGTNRATADVYQAEVTGYAAAVDAETGAAKAVADVYASVTQGYSAEVSAEADRVTAIANTNRAQIGAYTARVSAYGELVQAFTAQVGAHEAQVRAEVAKADVFRSEVAAFSAKVDAHVSLQSGKVDIFKAKVDNNVAITRRYAAEVDGYKAGIDAEVAALTAKNTYYTALSGLESASARRLAVYSDIARSRYGLEADKFRISMAVADSEIQGHIRGYEADMAQRLQSIQHLSDTMDRTLRVYDAQTASAQAIVTGLTSAVSVHSSVGFSQSANEAVSYATSLAAQGDLPGGTNLADGRPEMFFVGYQ